jgi:hypothetical protein
MKKSLAAAWLLAAVGVAPALAQTGAPPQAPVCLQTFLIDHTHVVDPKTILFYMRDGTVWRNALIGTCPGLMFNGFVYVTPENDICAKQQSIRVLVTRDVCMLGEFTRYVRPAAP